METPDLMATANRLLAGDTFESTCPSRPVMSQVTTRWSLLIVAALITGPHRFAALRDKIGGISEKMLSQNLKNLVRAGLVGRDVQPTVPPQVTYTLTDLGMSLAEPLCALLGWFGNHTPDLLEAQSRYDAA
ncbi:winged helix-turn-helix transcriptional regulator [Actinoplanes sp. NPDC051494]|uniref:winged helix-turn-helix transcriptional regulator n=1 Tax=Actinoplanes sp. NPDC051494 TaxID=3363907 RepID=UPI003795780D